MSWDSRVLELCIVVVCRLALLRDSEQQTIERTISGSEVVLECIEGPLCGLPGLPVSSEADPLSTTALNLNEHSVHVSVTVESAALQASASGAAAPRVPDIVAVEDEDAAKRHVLSAAAAEFVIPAAAATESTESCSVQQVSTLMVASTSAPLSLAPAAAEAAPTPAGTNVSSSTVAPASASTSAAISAINTAVITSTSQPAGQLVASHVAASFPAASMAGSVMGMSIPGSVRSHKSHSHKDHNSVTIKADTRVKDAAGAIFKVIDRLSTAFVTALRVEPTHEALNRAVKSIAVARKYVHDNLPGMDVSFLPFYR